MTRSVAAGELGLSIYWQEILAAVRLDGFCVPQPCHGGRGEPLLLPQGVAQNFAQPSVRAEEPQANGYGGNSQTLGYFVSGILQDIAQQTDLPQVRSEACDRACHQDALLAARIALFGIIGARGEPVTESFFRYHSGFFQRD